MAMALPNFHGGLVTTEPIYSNLSDCVFISNHNDYLVPVENLNLDGLLLNCDIQDMPDIGWDVIKSANFLILNQYDKRGSIIKIEVFEVKNKNLFTSLSWESQSLSYIKASYDIIDHKSFPGELKDLASELEKVGFNLSQFKRDLKLNSILN